MNIHVITIFPEVFLALEGFGILKIAKEKSLLNVFVHNLRDYTEDKHKTTDDRPYGGGAGMVMLASPLIKSIKDIESNYGHSYRVFITPQGEKFNMSIADFLSKKESLILFPAHYEGIDERVIGLFDMEVSVGDFIVSGGEIPALLIMDAITRLIPGVLGNEESLSEESFSKNLLEYPHYSRPEEISGEKVPGVLLSGNHEKIRKWRLKESLKRTLIKRSDLMCKRSFSEEEKEILLEIKQELDDIFKKILKG
jgi:tRNA (guanine37-N1)-methyltransferase